MWLSTGTEIILLKLSYGTVQRLLLFSFRIFYNTRLEALSKSCILSIWQASQRVTINTGSDCPLALINSISEYYNYDFNGTEILLIKLSKGTFQRLYPNAHRHRKYQMLGLC